MFFSGGCADARLQNCQLGTPLRSIHGRAGRLAQESTERGRFCTAMGRMCAISSSVDFIDRRGNKKPGTTRSQIVPPPALTFRATQASALLGNLSDLLSFSTRYRDNIVHYISFIHELNESIALNVLYYF
jgi:hypothetical protein